MKKEKTRQGEKRHSVLDEDRDKAGGIFDDLEYLRNTDQNRAFENVVCNVLLFP